jgi:hypothetical protein
MIHLYTRWCIIANLIQSTPTLSARCFNR